MMRDVRDTIQLDENNSSRRATTTLRQETLLNEIEKAFEDDEEAIVAKFARLRYECIHHLNSELTAVTKVERLRVNVIADVLALDKPVSNWEDFLPSQKA